MIPGLKFVRRLVMRFMYTWAVLPATVLVLTSAACSGDPEVRKHEYVAAADQFVTQDKLPEAVVEYRNAIQQDERFGEARFKLSKAYEAIGDLPAALREAVRAADLMPDNVEAQVRAARLLLRGRQFDDARVRAVAALAKDPKHVEAMIVLGNTLARLKEM